jgi:hypothetical protein
MRVRRVVSMTPNGEGHTGRDARYDRDYVNGVCKGNQEPSKNG